MHRYSFRAMSTHGEISINQELFANDLAQVNLLFSSIEDTCSRFREDSELSRLNQQIGIEVQVTAEFFRILKEALQFYEKTNGVFNAGILLAIENSGYTKSIEYIRGRNVGVSSCTAPIIGGRRPYRMNEERRTVILQTPIDLGGIAKGWVIDLAAELLSKYGDGFINVGGDIRIFGRLPRPLNIGIEDPFDPAKIISSIQVSEGAVATSTTMKRRWKMNGVAQHHLIDTATGEPSASTIVSSTVTAPTATEADVLAKVTLLLGEEHGKSWIFGKKGRAVLINNQKEIWRGGE